MEEGDSEPLVEVRFKWFDDACLLTDDRDELLVLALKSLGVTSRPAVEVFKVLLSAHKAGLSVSAREVRDKIVADRRKSGDASMSGLTLRNIQVWLKYFSDIGFLDASGDKYMFRAAKRPSACFEKYSRPVVDACMDYTLKALKQMEEAYGIK